jgi:gliding motility-associated transport system permease protein
MSSDTGQAAVATQPATPSAPSNHRGGASRRFLRGGTIMAVARREFRAYFNSPIAYLAISVFWVVCGILFFVVSGFFEGARASLRPLFEWIPMIFVFFVPALSMRLFAEEKRSGTLELLLTFPLTDGEVVLGKFLGSLGFLAVTLGLTLVYPALVSVLGSPDWGPIIGGYIGLMLVGGAYLAIGLMTSTWTENQIISFILALVFSSFFFFIDRILTAVWTGTQSFFNFLSFNYHFANIAKGVLDTRDILYFVSVTAAALLIASYTLKSRNWK